MVNKLCIIGVGLIGGSIAKAARVANPQLTIIGFGRALDEANLIQAKALGVIDDYTLDITVAVTGVDMVVLAIPVGAYVQVLQLLQPHWSNTACYTDAGSTKSSVVAACEQIFGAVPSNFILAHPIAGAEQSGVGAAKADLFIQKRVILTPLADSHATAVQHVQQFWQSVGADIALMSTEQHDAVLAATSHLPHLLAFTLVDLLGHKDEQAAIFRYAAGGFKDFTRIASSDPTMWRDICLANQQHILPLLAELQVKLAQLQQHLMAAEGAALLASFAYAKEARARFLAQFER